MPRIERPNKLTRAVTFRLWKSWSEAQQQYVLAHEGQPTGRIERGSGVDARYYTDKTWKLDPIRPEYRESCSACGFPVCFYAVPRNWSMGCDSDVWNLMKCGNVECQALFESCS